MARLSKVAVVGGGIGGLTAALALLREGIDVDVYERAPEGGWAPAFRSARRNTRLAWRSSASPRSRGGEGHPALEHGPELQAVRSRRGFPRALWISLRIHAPAGFARHAGGGNPTPEARCLASRHTVRRRRPVGDRRDASFPYQRDCAGRADDRCRRRSFDCAREPVRRRLAAITGCIGSRTRSATTGSSPTTPRRFQSEPWPASSEAYCPARSTKSSTLMRDSALANVFSACATVGSTTPFNN
jgi:glycine/D-amino acid oxidase-like deaminating enzyme